MEEWNVGRLEVEEVVEWKNGRILLIEDLRSYGFGMMRLHFHHSITPSLHNTMRLFYSTDIQNNTITLDPGESAHCLRVLRSVKGDHVQVIDGRGNLYDAIISHPDLKGCRLEIESVQIMPPPRDFNLHIAIAPTKSIERFEWFVEKAVEIGIDTITPLLCQRSERKTLKTDRLEKLVISTMKQAKVFTSPVLNELMDLNQFLRGFAMPATNRFIAHCENSEKKPLTETFIRGKDLVILVGPEGDFSKDEINAAISFGFVPVSLGTTRLRTETAGIVACTTILTLCNIGSV